MNFYRQILARYFLIFLLLGINETKAEDKIDEPLKGRNAITSISIDRTANTEDGEVGSDLIYDVSLEIDRDSLTSDSVTKRNTVTSMTSKSNIIINLSYGETAPSTQNMTENKMGYAIVNLRNEDGVILRAKVRIDKTRLSFDEKGKSEFTTNSEFLPSNKQPNGTYRGAYYIVLLHD